MSTAINEGKLLKAQWLRKQRTDKRVYIDQLAAEAERVAAHQEQGTVFRINKQICRWSHSSNAVIRDKQGHTLTSDKEQERRWAEHLEEVLNRNNPSDLPHTQEAHKDLDINVEPPTKEESVAAIKELKNKKAPGHDQLNSELFKTDLELASNRLLPLFVTVWKEKIIPEVWCKGTIITFPKKDDLTNCNKYRGITLLSVPSKILWISPSPSTRTTHAP